MVHRIHPELPKEQPLIVVQGTSPILTDEQPLQ